MHTPRRSDSRRNRAAIVRVATDAYTRGRAVASLARIADLAGVGQATVYRHFPHRRALAVAVMHEQLALLDRVVADHAHEPAAFRPVLRAVLLAQISSRPLVALLSEQPEPDQRRYLDQLVDILSGPFRRAQAHGLLRPHLRPGDLAVVFTMVEAVMSTPVVGAAGEDRARGAIDLVFDGLFGAAPTR